ncbi:MAG: maleate cis-trans isomerase [Halobacteriales archaeon]|nr:maleate cis-trans isomerase [Halobacteriales archaeon]
MYGWRGRIGLIVPSSNTTNEPEFRGVLPAGVSVHTARMHLEGTTADELAAMAENAATAADLLSTADVDVIAYGCTTGSLVHGPGHDEEIEHEIEMETDIPTVATAASVKRAFEYLGLESIAIATPYIDELNEREREFLEAAGYTVTGIDGLDIEPNLGIGRRRPEIAYRRARAVDTGVADGIFISCTNFRTFEIIERLEADLGKPVVTSNQATLWDALRHIDIDHTDIELGRLFDPIATESPTE